MEFLFRLSRRDFFLSSKMCTKSQKTLKLRLSSTHLFLSRKKENYTRARTGVKCFITRTKRVNQKSFFRQENTCFGKIFLTAEFFFLFFLGVVVLEVQIFEKEKRGKRNGRCDRTCVCTYV